MSNKRNRTIPIRETLERTIFEELQELYPTVSNRGIEYKQTCSFLGLPCDFDFMELSDNVEEFNDSLNSVNKINVSDVFALLVYCLMKMAKENGFYFVCHKKTIREIAFDLSIYDVAIACNVFDFLVQYSYLYNFDNKITSTIAVRNYECIQSSRVFDRSRKSKESKKEIPDDVVPTDLILDLDKDIGLIDEIEEFKEIPLF